MESFVCFAYCNNSFLNEQKITGTFQLNQGTQLKILVGHEGRGGGGGASDNFANGDSGQATRNGTKCGGTRGVGVKCAMLAREKKILAYWLERVLG
mgnify:FL=1